MTDIPPVLISWLVAVKRRLSDDTREIFGNDRDAYVAAKFVQHQHLRGAHQLEGRLTFQRLMEDGVDPVAGKLHRLLGAASEAIDHHAVVRCRGASGLHYRNGFGRQMHYAGLNLFPLQPFRHVSGHHDGFDPELFETVCQQRAGGFPDINQSDPGRGLSAARRRREDQT